MLSLSTQTSATGFSPIRKVFNQVIGRDDLVRFTVGEPNFDTPSNIVDAAVVAMRAGDTHYVHNAGTMELRTAIAAKVSADGTGVYDPQTEIAVTNGGTEALYLAMQAILNPGDEVLCPDPGWSPYVLQIALCGGVPITVPSLPENEFFYTAEDLERKVTKRTKLMILNSPQNPTGTVISEAALEEVAAFALRHDLYVISDEVYEKLLYDGADHISIASLPGMKERTILVNSFSKSYAMTGWRIGYACANQQIIDNMVKGHELDVSCCNSFVQAAAQEALSGPQTAIEEMVRIYGRRRRLIVDGINSLPLLSCSAPQGTFYSFMDIRRTGLGSEEFMRRLLDEAKVVVIPGWMFGSCGEGFVRLSFAVSDEVIGEGLSRMEKFVRSIH